MPDIEAEDAREALAGLVTYSLARRVAEPPGFIVHRLVQQVTRAALDEATAQARLTEALGWVHAAFAGNPQDVRTWARLDPLTPHAEAVALRADERGVADPTARLMNQMGPLSLEKALYPRAEILLRRALAIGEIGLDRADPAIAAPLNNVAELLRLTNRPREAEPFLRCAIAVVETCHGKNHPEASGPLANLALLLKDTSQFDEAESLYRRAIMIDEASFGRDHPHVALDLNNLARLLQDTNRLGEAEPLMRRALAIFLAFQRDTSHVHLHRDLVTANYEALLTAMGKSEAEIAATIAALHHEVGLGQG